MNFAGSVKGRILSVFSMTNQRKMFIFLVRKEKVAIIKRQPWFLSERSERLEAVCQVKLVPLQGNAVLGTNSIPVFSPVGIMPLYLQTLCHGNVQEGLKQLRNALPGYIFFYLKATILLLFSNRNANKWRLVNCTIFCSIDLIWKSIL